jgi:hypothetical protein
MAIVMAIDYKNTEEVMVKAAIFLAAQAKLELSAKRTRVSIRAKWKKVGDGWEVEESQKKTFRGNYIATGNLFKSIKPISKGLEFGMTALWYADAIRAGRKPWPQSKFEGNIGIPPDKMSEWTKNKRLRPRDLKSGQFIQNNRNNRNAMNFLMNRKIKHFGIQPFDFKRIAQQSMLAMFKPAIDEAIKKDQTEYLKNKQTEK